MTVYHQAGQALLTQTMDMGLDVMFHFFKVAVCRTIYKLGPCFRFEVQRGAAARNLLSNFHPRRLLAKKAAAD